jgi:hypothetical protein
MSKSYFVHGSSVVIDDPKRFKFSLFNYQFDKQLLRANHNFVNNGLDADGPGTYAIEVVNGTENEVMGGATRYSDKNITGSVVGFSVDSPLISANTCDPEHISTDEWVSVVNYMVDEWRRLGDCDYDGATDLANELSEDFESGVDADSMERLIELMGPNVELDALQPSRYEDGDGWREAVLEHLAEIDPAAFIWDAGGPEGVVGYAINNSDDLWGVMTRIYNSSACDSRGAFVTQCMNKTFQHAVINNVDDYASLAFNRGANGVCVFFITDDIELELVRNRKVVVDTPRVNAVVDEIIENNEYDKSSLSTNQHATKINSLIVNNFGVTLPADVLPRLTGRLNASFRDELIVLVGKSVGSVVYEEWERSPDVSHVFIPERRQSDSLEQGIKMRR